MGLNELLTVKEAAQWLKTSRVQIRKMIQNGELLAVKVGREYRIPITSIRGFIENSCVRPLKARERATAIWRQ